MANIYTPDGKESIRRIHTTPEDRAKHNEQFREQKAFEQKNKEERFAKIREDRKNRPAGAGGAGINIEVTKGE